MGAAPGWVGGGGGGGLFLVSGQGLAVGPSLSASGRRDLRERLACGSGHRRRQQIIVPK